MLGALPITQAIAVEIRKNSSIGDDEAALLERRDIDVGDVARSGDLPIARQEKHILEAVALSSNLVRKAPQAYIQHITTTIQPLQAGTEAGI